VAYPPSGVCDRTSHEKKRAVVSTLQMAVKKNPDMSLAPKLKGFRRGGDLRMRAVSIRPRPADEFIEDESWM
jgi:hypothetical protein